MDGSCGKDADKKYVKREKSAPVKTDEEKKEGESPRRQTANHSANGRLPGYSNMIPLRRGHDKGGPVTIPSFSGPPRFFSSSSGMIANSKAFSL